MGLYNHALYQVATKLLLFQNDKILVLSTPKGYLDFPGGRVDESERDVPWADALRREIAEEIGSVQVLIDRVIFVGKRQYDSNGQTHYIATIFFRGDYEAGDIRLSDEHGDFRWMTPTELLSSKLKFVSDNERAELEIYLGRA